MHHLKFYLTIIAFVTATLSPFIYSVKIARADLKSSVPIQSSILTNQSFTSQGTEILLNGKTLTIPWGQWQVGKSLRLGISDTALDRQMGVELFSNSNYQTQPLDWYATQRSPINLKTKLSKQYRYLDITDLAKSSGWQWQLVGSKLQLNTPPTRVTKVQRQTTPKNGKIAVTLAGEASLKENRSTPWKLSQTPTEGYLTIEATADPALLAQFNVPPTVDPANIDPDDDPTAQKLEYKVTSNNNQTIIQFPIVKGQRARAKLLSSTHLEVSINSSSEMIPDREINWAPGLKWRQKWIRLVASNFPVSYLEIDPRQKSIKLRPILSQEPNQEPNLVGSNHLIKFAPPIQVAAAINGGYFNRNNRMPLGAIKRDGQWLSSPILNRGVVGWNDGGKIGISRLKMQETIDTSTGAKLPTLALNSAYAQAGWSRYTSEWGSTYTPIQANESIVTIQQDKVTQITPGNLAGSIKLPIPIDGYLLVLRGQPELFGSIKVITVVPSQTAINLKGGTSANEYLPELKAKPALSSLPIGTTLTIKRQLTLPEFENYAQILGAGPWLVQSGRIVLDAKSENFGAAFSKESAVRSAIANTSTGNIILVAVHNRAGGKGPTLAEMAQLMQQMGTTDALNLDGGSSTSLYLGGQLVDRASATAARVHNAIGISIQP
ncbi:MAG: phosphodiester glycosidase family protein [Chamaesiphon sp.]|nr:phosphodiester glycosidase family protein [Chamaesiphon sp.]